MGIWVYILLAIVLSRIALGKKNIAFEHYIWMLLPIDMYGVTMFDFTLKPYMLFSALLFFRMCYCRRIHKLYIGSSWRKYGLILCILALVTNLLNGAAVSSVMAILMTLVVYSCCLVYTTNIRGSYAQIIEVITATSVGYGLVFITVYLLFWLGVDIPGAVTAERMEPGMIMQFGSMSGDVYIRSYRLRGFLIDPNSLIGMFAPAIAASVVKMSKDILRIRDVLALLVTLGCVFLSNSRMGVVCAVISVALGIFLSLRIMPQRKKGNFIFMLVVFAVMCSVALIVTETGKQMITRIYYDVFGYRSGLSGKYGRIALWKEALQILTENNALLGVGQGQIRNFSSTELDGHNTWIEWICGSGIIVGGAIVLYFWMAVCWAWKVRNIYPQKSDVQSIYYVLLVGFTCVMISLLTVDNITYSYLWFLWITLQNIVDKRDKQIYAQGRCYNDS